MKNEVKKSKIVKLMIVVWVFTALSWLSLWSVQAESNIDTSGTGAGYFWALAYGLLIASSVFFSRWNKRGENSKKTGALIISFVILGSGSLIAFIIGCIAGTWILRSDSNSKYSKKYSKISIR